MYTNTNIYGYEAYTFGPEQVTFRLANLLRVYKIRLPIITMRYLSLNCIIMVIISRIAMHVFMTIGLPYIINIEQYHNSTMHHRV